MGGEPAGRPGRRGRSRGTSSGEPLQLRIVRQRQARRAPARARLARRRQTARTLVAAGEPARRRPPPGRWHCGTTRRSVGPGPRPRRPAGRCSRSPASSSLEASPPLPGLEPIPIAIGASRRVELAQHDPRLDRAVPVVDLQPHRDVDRVVLADPEARAAKGDAERPVGAAVEAEARVLALPHRPHVAHPGRGDKQPHPGVAHPERRKPAQLLGEVEPEAGTADHRVDPLGPLQVLGPEHLGRMGGKRLAEGVEVPRLAAPSPAAARCPPKRTRCSEQASKPSQQIEARDAAPRAPPAALRRRARSRPPADGGARPGARRRSRSPPGASPRRRGRAPGASRSSSGSSRRAASAAASTSRSVARRSPLARLSSAAISSARASSSVRNSSTPASAR